MSSLKYSKFLAETVSEPIVPVRVAMHSYCINSGYLLGDNPPSASLTNTADAVCTVEKGGFAVLDMGTEIRGSVEVTFESFSEHNKNVRITLGESLMEALGKIGEKNSTNDHSVRDFTVMSSGYATVKSGNTGYRFVKIEALECDVCIRCVRGIFVHRDIERVGSFECSDAEVNKIWDVGAYTVFLNMQEYLLDGIKRD